MIDPVAISFDLAVLLMLFALMEYIALYYLDTPLFRFGVLYKRKTDYIHVKTDAFELGRRYKTLNARFKLTEDGECVFCGRVTSAWTVRQVLLLFRIKGRISWRGEKATVEFRMPVFAPLTALAIAVTLILFGFIGLMRDPFGGAIVFGMGMFLYPYMLYWIFEKSRTWLRNSYMDVKDCLLTGTERPVTIHSGDDYTKSRRSF